MSQAPTALRTRTEAVQAWRDDAGTVRVHVVVAATNDSGHEVSLAASDRTFTLRNAAGRTLHAGRFPYAFPSELAAGETSHLFTTVVLPVHTATPGLRVEARITGDRIDGRPVRLEVSGLRVVELAGEIGVAGIVVNPGSEQVTNGIVGVICRDRAGRIVGGLYDNVDVARIAPGGRVRFETSYPGLPPAGKGLIAELTAVAFEPVLVARQP